MKREIRIRQKRICVWILIVTLLWNSFSPVVVHADITRGDVSGASISTDEILNSGDVIYCSETDGLTLYYYDHTMQTIIYDDTDETAGIFVENAGTHTVVDYPISLEEGENFGGWKVQSIYQSAGMVSSLTLTPILNYTITYVTNGGTNSSSNPTSYTYGTAVTLAEASKTGYTFSGWYTDEACTDGNQITEITADESGPKTLYAKFTENTIDSVVFENSGTVEVKAGVAYTLGSGTWKVTGDNTSYAGGMTFYVEEDGSYEFVKQ